MNPRAGRAPAPRTPRRGPRAGDDGVAAVLVLTMASVLVLVAAVAASLAAVAVARQRAAAAADLSALAAAQHSLSGPAVACARAEVVARRAGARVTSCALDGDVATVLAQVRPAGPVGLLGSASVRARAGPPLRGSP